MLLLISLVEKSVQKTAAPETGRWTIVLWLARAGSVYYTPPPVDCRARTLRAR